jgi:hypothetical protein
MDGWIAAPPDSRATIESSTKWYEGLTDGRLILAAMNGTKRTTTNRREPGESSTSTISSRIQESQVMDTVFVKECQSLKSREK